MRWRLQFSLCSGGVLGDEPLTSGLEDWNSAEEQVGLLHSLVQWESTLPGFADHHVPVRVCFMSSANSM